LSEAPLNCGERTRTECFSEVAILGMERVERAESARKHGDRFRSSVRDQSWSLGPSGLWVWAT
jgi:hypothetical protein